MGWEMMWWKIRGGHRGSQRVTDLGFLLCKKCKEILIDMTIIKLESSFGWEYPRDGQVSKVTVSYMGGHMFESAWLNEGLLCFFLYSHMPQLKLIYLGQQKFTTVSNWTE